MRRKVRRGASLCALALGLALCGTACHSSSTAPATTTTPAAASITETFNGTVQVGGAAFYTFNVSQYGTVNLVLTSVSGALVPSTVMLTIGIGTPSGTGCATTSTATTASGSTVQLTGSFNAGTYCANVADAGNLFGPANFSLTIAHP